MSRSKPTISQDDSNSLNTLQYKKSSLCASASCVEIAFYENGDVYIRDSTDLTKSPLTFDTAEWQAFIGGVKNGEFDLK